MLLTHVLPGIVTVGVVAAGITLWRLAGVHRVRWIVATLTAYGAAAFVHATLKGVALPTLLGGQGLFRAIPYVLQGAFIGSFVVLPLGWIVAIVRAGIPRFREGSPRHNVYQAVALTMCVGIVVSSLPSRTSSAGSGAADTQSSAADVAALEKFFRAIEADNREAPRDSWDPDYVVNMVGNDPQQLFAWVRDNTYWIPYRGVLRGPVGVLMDGQGNSLDRSLLLATLLDKAGHSVRLAHGELTQEQARTLLPGLVAQQAVAFAPVETTSDQTLNVRAMAARYQLDGSSIESVFKADEEAFTHAASELQKRVGDQTERLLRAIKMPEPMADWSRRFERGIDALRDHWWVQRREDQTWIDLDLLDPSGTSGAHETAVIETVLPTSLAADLHHQIAVRVIAEQWSDGTLIERKALEHVLRPADLIGQSVVLQFWPLDWADPVETPQPPRDLRRAALDERVWATTLFVGSRAVATEGLLDTGDDLAAPVKGGPMSGIATQFAKTAGVKTPNKTLSAVSLEYEIRVPGEEPRTVRRTVFDLIGPAARASTPHPPLVVDDAKKLTRSLALMMRTEMLPLVCRFAPEFPTHLASESMIANRQLIGAAVRGELSPASAGAEDSLFAHGAPASTSLYTLALTRMERNRDAQFVYVDRPGLITNHTYPAAVGSRLTLRDATDIVANEIGVSLAAPDAFRVRVAQGVLDTNAESLFHIRANAFGNSGDAFASSQSWVTLTSNTASALDRMTLPDDVRGRIRVELAEGYVVVAPDAPVPMHVEPFAGWWQIDPTTGRVLGFGANGWGSVMIERAFDDIRKALQGQKFITYIQMFNRGFYFDYFFCVAGAIDPHHDATPFDAVGRHLPQALQGPSGPLMSKKDEPTVSVTASLVTSPEQCAPRAALWGVATAVSYLVFFTLRPVIAARLWKSARLRVVPKDLPPDCKVDGPLDEMSKTKPDMRLLGKTEDMGKTQPDPSSPVEPEGPSPVPERLQQATDDVDAAKAASRDADAQDQKATEDFLRYRADRPGSKAPGADPSKYDPLEQKRLEDIAREKGQQYRERLIQLSQAENALNDLKAWMRRAERCGGGKP